MLNPEYDINVLELCHVERLLKDEDLSIHGVAPQALADIVRVKLLLLYGGIWADASVYPARPIDGLIAMAEEHCGFFAFYRPGADRIISSWFLIATKSHPIVVRFWEAVKAYWAVPRALVKGIPENPIAVVSGRDPGFEGRYPYFWFHYLFQKTVEVDKNLGAVFRRMPRIYASTPHNLQFAFASRRSLPIQRVSRILRSCPVHKLDWRSSYPAYILDSNHAFPPNWTAMLKCGA